MKLFSPLILIYTACVIAGCSRPEPMLDEAIDALSDEWGPYSDKLERLAKEAGTTVLNRESSTNNYAMLNRVIAVTNVQERIRLTWKLYNHCRRTPEWYVEHREDRGRNHHRKIFLHNCAHELMMSPNATPATIVEGWKIKAAIVKDMEELMRLTGPEWQARMQKRYEVEEAARYAEFRRRLKAHGGGPASYYHQKHAPELGFADTATGNVDEWPEPGNGRVSHALSIDRRDFKPQWNRLQIVKRGVGDIEVGLSYSREYTKFTIRIR